VTSLGLFVGDVELILRDLYGDVNKMALDRTLSAVRCLVEGFAKYVSGDLWQEYLDAWDFDYGVLTIGVEPGYGINSNGWRHAECPGHC